MPFKKNKQDDNSDSEEEYVSESSDSDIDSDGNYIGENQIEATFEGRNPEDCDYHGIQALLRQLFLKSHVNLSELTELIISHNYIGSVVKQSSDDPMNEDEENELDEDEDDDALGGVFGLTTILNITANKDKQCIEEIRSLLTSLAEENAKDKDKQLIMKLLNDSECKVGLIINERIMNIPAAISVPLFKSLKSELERAVKKNMPYNFTHLVWICKTYTNTPDELTQSDLVWANSEEENLLEHSIASFDVNVSKEMDSSQWEFDGIEMTPLRKIVVFDAKKFPQLVDVIESHVVELQENSKNI